MLNFNQLNKYKQIYKELIKVIFVPKFSHIYVIFNKNKNA